MDKDTASEAPGAAKKDDISTASTEKKPEEVVDEFPDPDEDDLDDLDDMLDDFSASKSDPKKAAETTSAAKPETAKPFPTAWPETPADATSSEEEVAKQLRDGIAGLIEHIGKDPEMVAQFDQMFDQMAQDLEGERSAASAEPATKPPDEELAEATSDAATALGRDKSFQQTIRQTVERMQASGEKATSAAAASGGEDDYMAEFMKQMASGEFTGEGNEEEFSKMLMGMMEQLTSKEILYEPMKELDDKLPGWLEKNASSTPPDELKKYREQKVLVGEIVAKFEASTYNDGPSPDRDYIVDRMHKMQALGSPPEDLLGDMPSTQEAMAASQDQCNPQ